MIAWEHIDVHNQTHIASLNGSILLVSSTFTQSSRLGVELAPARWALEWFKLRGVRGVIVMNTQSSTFRAPYRCFASMVGRCEVSCRNWEKKNCAEIKQ
jgi:hypothetical protein